MSNGFILEIVTIKSVVLTRDWNSKNTKKPVDRKNEFFVYRHFLIILFLNHTFQNRLYRLQYT